MLIFGLCFIQRQGEYITEFTMVILQRSYYRLFKYQALRNLVGEKGENENENRL